MSSQSLEESSSRHTEVNGEKNRWKEKLAFGRMFKTAILNSTKQLWLEQEVSETGTVDPDVAPDLLFSAINVLA